MRGVGTSGHRMGENARHLHKFHPTGGEPENDHLSQHYLMNQRRDRAPNPTDSWIAPEHARMGAGMRRYRYGVRGDDGLWVVKPGDRVLPKPECLRQQEWTEHLLNRPANCKCEQCVHIAKVELARSKMGHETW